MFTLKQKVGCWLNERWRTEWILRSPRLAGRLHKEWRDLHNRHERISPDGLTEGRVCHWRDSSPLTVARVFPAVGARILHHVLNRWPVCFADGMPEFSGKPDVSVVIGVRGTGRLPQFQATLASLMGQQDCAVEILVVEQSWKPEFGQIIPRGVRYIHTPATSLDMPYNRSWALNVGARQASGRIVVLHDGDYVVPGQFAAEIARRVCGPVQSARIPRYIFYFDQSDSEQIQSTRSFSAVRRMDKIVQNNPTPMALTRDAYLSIGGHDEAFYGWGGEDNEFLDRARTLIHAEGAFLPVFHLWHPEAPNRSGDRNRGLRDAIMAINPADRADQLMSREFGFMTPSVVWHPPGETRHSSSTHGN